MCTFGAFSFTSDLNKNGKCQSISTICHENRKLLKKISVPTKHIVMTISSDNTARIHCHQKCTQNKAYHKLICRSKTIMKSDTTA